MLRRKRDGDADNTDRWLMTYADLITLLLAFFVVMYAISQIDIKKFDKMAVQLQGVFHGGNVPGDSLGDRSELGEGVLKVGRLKVVAQRVRNLTQQISDEGAVLGAQIFRGGITDSIKAGKTGLRDEPLSVELNERGLVIHIVDKTLFESGQASLRPEALAMLERLATEFKGLPNQIRVEGHTDSLPIATPRFPSNWELSSARATAVLRWLVDGGYVTPERVSALGFGEHRPIASNDNPEGRARNRRVDIVILTDALSNFEPKAQRSPKANPPQAGNNLQVGLETSSD